MNNIPAQPYIKTRHSNAGLFGSTPTIGGTWESYGGTSGLMGGVGTTTSGSSGLGFNPYELINTGLGTIENIVTSIWGKGDKYKVQALQYLNEEQKKTTYILWAIIGIVLVLALILVFKKK